MTATVATETVTATETAVAIAGATIATATATIATVAATVEAPALDTSLIDVPGLCIRCVAWHDAEDIHSQEVCPTCGEASIEWDQMREIDALLTEMNSFEALADAVFA